jgi:peptidoglycan/xylan/chitin deacetylase (PgdA/CDA1 family)
MFSPSPNPILMYHHIAPAPPEAGPRRVLYVPRGEFAAQLDALLAMGYRSVTGAQYTAALLDGSWKRQRLAWITFDDGFRNNFTEALPELQARGMVATFFVVLNHTLLNPQPDYMTPADLLALRDAGMEVASHTLSHPRLTQLPPTELARELAQSREHLEEHLGQKQGIFCYPYGDHNATVLEATRQAGYNWGVATLRGNQNSEADRYRLKRIMVAPGRTGWKFRYSFTPLYHWLHARKNKRKWPG